MHRYKAHFVQRTVKVDKKLVAIGQAPTESKHLLRGIFAAFAEETMIRAENIDDTSILVTASSIADRTYEIRNLL